MNRLAIVFALCGIAFAQGTMGGGKVTGGSAGFNLGGPPNYTYSPHGVGTAVQITSVPNAGTSVAAGCSGSQLYLLVTCGNLTGYSKQMTDTQFSALGGSSVQYLRLTDANFVNGAGVCPTFSGAGAQNGFEIGPGGGDYTNPTNTNHTFVLVAQNGGGSYVVPVKSDFTVSGCPLWPTGNGDTGPYSATSTSGVVDNTGWWSGVSANVFYIMPGTAIYKMTIAPGCDTTHTTTAQGCTVTSSLVHDFNGDACFGTELAGCSGNTSCWNGVFDVDRADSFFSITLGARGSTFSTNAAATGQGTGTKVAFYDVVNGCKEYETRKGLISPTYNSPPTQAITDQNSNPLYDRYGIHDDTMTRTGTVVSVGTQICYLKSAALPTPRATTWTATHTYAAGSWIIPADGNNIKGSAMYTSAGGTSGGSEPTWDGTALNATITDGTVTWIYEGNFGALTDWVASTPYAAYMFLQPTTNNAGGYIYQNVASSGGTSSASRPTFNQTPNTTTTDGSASWLNIGTPTGTFGCSGGPDQWNPSTNTVYTNPSATYTGHYVLGDHTYIAGGGNLTFGATKYSAWTNTVGLIPNNAACSASTCPGQHINDVTANASDTNVIIGGMAYGSNAILTGLSGDTTGCQTGSTFPVSCAHIANSPGYEEVGFQQANTFCSIYPVCDTDTYIRFGLQFNTGQSNLFNAQQGTASVCQDGSCAPFTSDWMCTLGNTAGGANASPNAIDWKASQTWTTGTIINPTVGNGSGATSYDYVATVGGAGSGTEPTWTGATTVGSTVTENAVTWTNIGSPSGTTSTSAGCRSDAFLMVLK